MQVIILAGGKGTRLKPYTTVIPKPLVPLGDYPILEIVLKQLAKNGFRNITLAVGHLADLIKAYFGSGNKWDLHISYSYENEPLGTVGPLKLINELEENFLVMNSDDLTDINYKEFFDFHLQHKAPVTIAIYKKEVKIDLGTVSVDMDNRLKSYIEKPTYHFNVSMGIYAFNKKALKYIPRNTYFDFPDLIKKLLAEKIKVMSYPHEGFWLDIGRPEDYEKAAENFQQILTQLL